MNPVELSIKSKIELSGIPLKDWNVSINRGILTGLNDAFIISGDRKDELIRQDPKSAELIRPILRGRDIKRYGHSFADLWLLFIPWHFPLQFDESITGASSDAEKMFSKQYPAVYSHLLLYKEDLANRNRAETGIRYEWYALQRWGAKYWDDFSKQKIIYREISDAMNATLAEPDIFINNKCYMITGEHLIYLLSFINSALFTKIILQQANLTGGKGEAFLSLIRLVRPSAETEEEIIRLFNNRKGATPTETKAIDRKVDAIFCQLFGLTETETNYILS